MVTFLKKFKNVAFTVFALSLATFLFSFKLLEKRSNVADELVWFQADHEGNIGPYIDTGVEPGGNCKEADAPRCAVGMSENDVDTSGPSPVSPINNISENSGLIKAERQVKL